MNRLAFRRALRRAARHTGSGKPEPVEALAERPEDIKHSQNPSAPPRPPKRELRIDLSKAPSEMEARWSGRT